ncbi:hypothetical protein BGZ60DRAFT_432572 [Tricladium varicosporioides]|nr:hypothetical protein BGZ60DRAFT_432572 [Hymenoscyphus varicosporioides]
MQYPVAVLGLRSLQPKDRVPPGFLTGLFYIVVSGLPWNTSWQDLKDYSRGPLDDGSFLTIDCVMVYPGTTDGWVRVWGREEFLKVLARLDGGIMKHKGLIADGRNATEWLTLKSLNVDKANNGRQQNETSSSFESATWESQEVKPMNAYTPSQAETPQFVGTTQHHPVGQMQWNYALQSHAANYSPNAAPLPAYTYTTQPHQIIYPVTSLPPMVTYIAPAPTQYSMISPQSSISAPRQWSPMVVVQTETRKIILKKLPHNMNEKSLRKFLQQVLPRECGPVHEIEIARAPQGQSKGHAFVTMESFAAANKALNVLDNCPCWGRCLKVALAKEGVAPPKHNHPAQQYTSFEHSAPRTIYCTPFQSPPSRRSTLSSLSSGSSSPTVSICSNNYSVAPAPFMVDLSNAAKSASIGPPPPTPMVVNGSSISSVL